MNPAFLLPLLRGFSNALVKTNDKHIISKMDIDHYFLGFWRVAMSVLILTLPLFFFEQYHHLANPKFLMYTMANVVGNVIHILIFYNIIKKFDISYVAIIKTSQPFIFAIVAFFILGEVLKPLAFVGMFLVIIGSFLLEKSRLHKKEKFNLLKSGWPIILLSILIAAVITNFSKMAVLEGDAMIYLWTRYFAMSIVFYVLYHIKYRKKNLTLKHMHKVDNKHILPATMSGIFLLISTMCEMHALKVLDIAVVEAITSVELLTLLVLEYMFITKEINRLRIISALIVLSGILLLILG